PKRVLCILRELTKIHEEYLKAPVDELCSHFEERPPRGEIVLLIGPQEEKEDWEALSLKEHVLSVQKLWNLSLNDAIKTVAQIRKVPKKDVYRQIHKD
ncbi:MAG: 16S rRNA (cytidine(1402)-2'-O)-methyltransferase, partial [Chlamydiales bacterium]|nr:16S rRNA (cytidine(1402)-2'-O)-methyltransferase [Chlamydiales bacterium]